MKKTVDVAEAIDYLTNEGNLDLKQLFSVLFSNVNLESIYKNIKDT